MRLKTSSPKYPYSKSVQEPELSSSVPLPPIFLFPSPFSLLSQGHLPLSRPLLTSSQAMLNRLAVFQQDRPKWSIPRSFHCSTFYRMLACIGLAFLLYLPTNLSFFFEAFLQYLVSLVLIVDQSQEQSKYFCVHPSHFLGYICDNRKQ